MTKFHTLHVVGKSVSSFKKDYKLHQNPPINGDNIAVTVSALQSANSGTVRVTDRQNDR